MTVQGLSTTADDGTFTVLASGRTNTQFKVTDGGGGACACTGFAIPLRTHYVLSGVNTTTADLQDGDWVTIYGNTIAAYNTVSDVLNESQGGVGSTWDIEVANAVSTTAAYDTGAGSANPGVPHFTVASAVGLANGGYVSIRGTSATGPGSDTTASYDTQGYINGLSGTSFNVYGGSFNTGGFNQRDRGIWTSGGTVTPALAKPAVGCVRLIMYIGRNGGYGVYRMYIATGYQNS